MTSTHHHMVTVYTGGLPGAPVCIHCGRTDVGDQDACEQAAAPRRFATREEAAAFVDSIDDASREEQQ